MQLGEKKTSQYFWLWEIWPLERGVPSGKGKVTWVSHVSVAQCLQRTLERIGGARRRAANRRRTYHVIYTSCKKLHFEIKLIPVFHCITGSLGHSTWWWWENIKIQGHIDITKSPLIEVALTGVWREWRGIRQESCHQQQLNIWPEENQSDKSEADWCTRVKLSTSSHIRTFRRVLSPWSTRGTNCGVLLPLRGPDDGHR